MQNIETNIITYNFNSQAMNATKKLYEEGKKLTFYTKDGKLMSYEEYIDKYDPNKLTRSKAKKIIGTITPLKYKYVEFNNVGINKTEIIENISKQLEENYVIEKSAIDCLGDNLFVDIMVYDKVEKTYTIYVLEGKLSIDNLSLGGKCINVVRKSIANKSMECEP